MLFGVRFYKCRTKPWNSQGKALFFCVLGLNVRLCAQISELSYDGESVAQRQYDLLHS